MKKYFITTLVFLIAIFFGYLIFSFQNPNFESLNPDQMLKRVIEERNQAIQKAVTDGSYRCCINPPCTMCYMEGNEWNNEKAGTCACDDLIAQGKEPCPQCKRGLCGSGDSCSVNIK